MFRAKITQRAVGQGGLCEGEIAVDDPPIRWLTDCGSNQSPPLVREISRLPHRLDLLFVSHLDADHVNGIDNLLAHSEVQECVLPYLNDHERLLTLAHAVSNGTVTGQFVEFLTDIAGWFENRGVGRVTFVGRLDGEGGAGDSPQLPSDPLRDLKGRLTPCWSESRPDRGAFNVKEGAYIQVRNEINLLADWVFLPHAHKPPARLLKAFNEEILVTFPGQATDQIIKNVRTEEGRSALHSCYDAIWSSDHNLVSMCVYAGPFSNAGRWHGNIRLFFRGWQIAGRAAGFLSTGDARLSRKNRLKAFRKFYGGVLDKIAVIVVPHHGALSSWNRDVLAGLTDLKVGCAAAGPNSYGHPHPAVIFDIEETGAQFVQVSDNPSTALVLNGNSG